MTAFLLKRPYVCPLFQSTFCFPILRIKYQYMTSDKMIFGGLLSGSFSTERQRCQAQPSAEKRTISLRRYQWTTGKRNPIATFSSEFRPILHYRHLAATPHAF